MLILPADPGVFWRRYETNGCSLALRGLWSRLDRARAEDDIQQHSSDMFKRQCRGAPDESLCRFFAPMHQLVLRIISLPSD